jgi:uncharacterized membrane protein YgdD (TMEM256/DUF423 family)
MKPHLWFVCGAILAALGVVNGAFAAHGLRDNLTRRYVEILPENMPDFEIDDLLRKRVGDFETGARYQMYHAFGLMILALAAVRKPSKLWSAAGVCFFFGTVLFSGCLYALVLTNKTWLGAVVPIGGSLFIVGWVLAAIAGYKLAAAEPNAA